MGISTPQHKNLNNKVAANRAGCVCGFEKGAAWGQRGTRPTGLRDPEALHLDHFLSPEGFLAATSLIKFYNIFKKKEEKSQDFGPRGPGSDTPVPGHRMKTLEAKVARGFIFHTLTLMAKYARKMGFLHKQGGECCYS